MKNKLFMFVFMFVLINSVIADENRKLVKLIGGDRGFVEAEICYEEKIDLTTLSNYSNPIQNLKGLISALKNKQPIERFVYGNKKAQLPVPKRFYTDQTNIQFKHIIYWDDYIGVGVQYYYPDNKNLHWREDFYCQNTNCLLDFDFSNNIDNQLFESIYYLIINEKDAKATPLKPVDNVYKIRVHNSVERKDNLSRCSLYLNYSLVELDVNYCLDCKNIKVNINGKKKTTEKILINSVLQLIKRLQTMDSKGLFGKDIKFTKIIGINDEEAGIRVKDYINYLSTWKNIKLLGYIKDSDQYFMFIEYNYSDEKHGKLEILRLKETKKLIYEFDLKIDNDNFGENIIYSRQFLDSIRTVYMPEVE